jgi:hypothetical protein
MNLREIEERVVAVEPRPGVEYLSDLLLAYGLPRTSVSRLMSGTYDKAETADERLWKDKVYFRYTDGRDEALYEHIDVAREDERVMKYRPRFLIVKNDERLLARDQKTGATLDIEVGELASHATFFGPWAGFERTQLENLNYADRKAAEKMAKLYDEVIRHNSIETEVAMHDLNVFFSRLLFCFFAEDTGVFEKDSFTNALGSFTRETGEDTNGFLDQLFAVLDTDPAERGGLAEHLRGFGYVNGNLFERRCPAPRFSAKARAVILECGTLDWSQINPDIFGSMIQAVVHPGQRAGLGMHYTSVENIMKVIRPLFLDDLEDAFEAADTVKKLDALLARIAAIQVFDPACGSGNFLVIAYKELRRLEHRILKRTTELEPHRAALFTDSRIRLDNFYGIELDDFAHEIATLSLWLAKHQINVEFEELFGAEIPLIPLREAANVVCGNAARIEWREVCDPVGETYVLGNPPYAGSRTQSAEQKADFAEYFGSGRYPKDLDYIALWFLKGARFLRAGSDVQVAFVSTNSVCQGEQIALMWPGVFDAGARISFGHQSFRWSNQARGNAGVSCVVVGLCADDRRPRNVLYDGGIQRMVKGISPYLSEGSPELIVTPRRAPLADLPRLAIGSKPVDGGHLVLSNDQMASLLAETPAVEKIIRRYGGSREAINGSWRACLWIEDQEVEWVSSILEVARRLERVRGYRALSTSSATRAFADQPHRFVHRAHKATSAILVPEVSSERREYVPIDFVGPNTVISNKAYAIYDAEPWLFALVHSRMHMVWVRAVGGRMKTDLSYSAGLVYNTFPVPELSDAHRAELTAAAVAVLSAREQFSGQTLAQLYDPDEMPEVLRSAHRDIDAAVDALYQPKPLDSDVARLKLLFEMYEAATREGPVPTDA